MVLGHYRCAIARCTNRLDAEQVINELKRVGVSTAQISIAPRDFQDGTRKEELGEAEVSELVEDNPSVAGAVVGILLGAIGGSLAGLGLLLMPEVGLILLAGGSGTVLLSTLAGAGCGIASSGLIQVCTCKKRPEEQAGEGFGRYSSGKYLVTVEGTDNEVHYAQSILRTLLKV